MNERGIHAVIEAGAGDEFDVADACGAGADCGSCLPAITHLLDEHAGPCGGGALTSCELRAALSTRGDRTAPSAASGNLSFVDAATDPA